MTSEKKKAPTKSEILNNLATASGLDKKDVVKLIDAMSTEIQSSLAAGGPGIFTIPGLIKIERKDIPAKPEQKNVPNRFKKGEFHDIPAKAASVKVKVRALKGLKDLVK